MNYSSFTLVQKNILEMDEKIGLNTGSKKIVLSIKAKVQIWYSSIAYL